jgi:hypothetical protein
MERGIAHPCPISPSRSEEVKTSKFTGIPFQSTEIIVQLGWGNIYG